MAVRAAADFTPLRAAGPLERELTGVQRRVLAELRREGIAIVAFDELFRDPELWDSLKAKMSPFVAEAEARLARGERPDGKKAFLIRQHPRQKKSELTELPTLRADGCRLRFAAGDALLGIVNAYRGSPVRLVDLDQWYTIPHEGGDERKASQLWHRDPEDEHVVKVFLYFSDVDEDAGPFEYVRRSAPGGEHGDLWPWQQGGIYPPNDEADQAIPPDRRMTATGPTGTLVVCDTAGLHRGGYCRSKVRVLMTQTYVGCPVTPENRLRRFDVEWDGDELSQQAAYALS
jgi:hypothetical protein